MVAPPRKHALKSADATSSPTAAPGSVRIIGGRWRGTRLAVLPLPGLRPTSDRVRETLFNWLQHEVAGATCLDLFAGTGALGFEACSRGAARVLMLERDPQLVAQLRIQAARLGAGDPQTMDLQVEQADALQWLASAPAAHVDIAFVDPPFAAGVYDRLWPGLDRVLRPRAWLYVESPRASPPAAPPGWLLHRQGHTREVGYALYQRLRAGPASSADA